MHTVIIYAKKGNETHAQDILDSMETDMGPFEVTEVRTDLAAIEDMQIDENHYICLVFHEANDEEAPSIYHLKRTAQ